MGTGARRATVGRPVDPGRAVRALSSARARTAVAASAVVLVAASPFLAGTPAAGAGLANLQVVDSSGVGAVVGVLTRVPAESFGGIDYAQTALTLDKGIGRAAPVFLGDLADTFIETSIQNVANPGQQLQDPVLVTAQYPPSATVPSEGSLAGVPPLPSGAGSVGRFHARANSDPDVTAEAVSAAVTGPPMSVSFASGAASSHTTVLSDGTVVTETRAAASNVDIGGVVTIAHATGVATLRVIPGQTPTPEVHTTVAGVLVNGVPAQLTDQGLKVSDQVPVTASEVAQLNAGLAQLQQAGVTVVAVPIRTSRSVGSGAASGAVAELRYNEGQGIGDDEDLLLGQVTVRATAIARPLETAPDTGTANTASSAGPGLGSGAQAPAGEGLTVSSPAPIAAPTGPGGVVSGGAGAATPGPGATAGSGASPGDLVLSRARSGSSPAARLATAYGVVLLAGLAGAGVLVARWRSTAT